MIDSWEQGDLAGAVHGLEMSLDEALAALAKAKGGAAWRTDEYRVQLAAPKLLEALESVMHWWKNTDHTDDDEMPADIFDQAHAIIAQAKGGAV